MLCQVPTSVEMELGVRIGSDFPIFRLDLCPKSIGIDDDVNSRFYCHCPLPKLQKQNFAMWQCRNALFSRPTSSVRPPACIAWKRLSTEVGRSAAQIFTGPTMPLKSCAPRS